MLHFLFELIRSGIGLALSLIIPVGIVYIAIRLVQHVDRKRAKKKFPDLKVDFDEQDKP